MLKQLATKSKLSSIGIEIDAHEFRALQLINDGKADQVLAWAVFPRMEAKDSSERTSMPCQEELAWAGSILARRGFVGRNVSITPSTSVCSSHVVELPPAESGAPVEQLARMEVARERRCGPTDFELGLWELPPKGKTQESLAVACPKSVIDSTLDLYEEAGFVVAGFDLLELAVCRGSLAGSVSNVSEAAQEINTFLHIGWSSSLAVLTLGEKVIYVRRIENGASSVWDGATNRYQLSTQGAQLILDGEPSDTDLPARVQMNHSIWSGLAKTLTDELDTAIAYISHSFRMAPYGKIILSGYGATNTQVTKALDQVLGIPIEPAGPPALLCKIHPTQRAWSIGSRLSTAYGLAARYDR